MVPQTSAYREPMPGDPVSGTKKLSALKKGLIPAIAAGLLGVCLLLFGGRVSACVPSGTQDGGSAPSTSRGGDPEAYRAMLEERVARLVGEVGGAGEVTVMVVLDGGFRQVYATEEKPNASGTARTYVTVGSGSSQSAVLVTEEYPAVTGIAVVCTGGSDPRVRQEVTSLLSAAFSLGSNKIYVTGR